MFVPLRHADEMEAEEGEHGNEVAGLRLIVVFQSFQCLLFVF